MINTLSQNLSLNSNKSLNAKRAETEQSRDAVILVVNQYEKQLSVIFSVLTITLLSYAIYLILIYPITTIAYDNQLYIQLKSQINKVKELRKNCIIDKALNLNPQSQISAVYDADYEVEKKKLLLLLDKVQGTPIPRL